MKWNAVSEKASGISIVCVKPSEKTCSDIDECLDKPHLCNDTQNCENNDGSYTCECINGFTEHADGSCLDIDECSTDPFNLTEIDNSTQLYLLAIYYNTTMLKNSTRLDNCDSFAFCNNIIGSFTCRCNTGR